MYSTCNIPINMNTNENHRRNEVQVFRKCCACITLHTGLLQKSATVAMTAALETPHILLIFCTCMCKDFAASCCFIEIQS